MIDESKKRIILYIGVVLTILTIMFSIGYYLVQGQKSSLPPVDAGNSPAPPNSQARTTTLKDNVSFIGFDELQTLDITETRVSVIQYYLALYANNTQQSRDITTFTFDKSSAKDSTEDDRHIFTFNTTDNKNTIYKVELAYVYSADAFVRIFDKDDKIIQTSPL